jgi:glycine/betaine/sarcosine/D-proline reductase family selenoprotein B
MAEIGAGIADELAASKINGVVLTATWGTGTRSGATIAKEIEKKGIPVLLITCLSNVAAQVGVGRIMSGNKFHYPVGQPQLPPEEELNWRAALLDKALTALETPVTDPKLF